MKKLVLLFLGIAAFAVCAFAEDTVVEEIVARINNQIITRAELRRGHDQMVQEVRQQYPNNADAKIAERDKDVLRDLIDQQLLIDKGSQLDINVDTQLVKKLDEVRKSMNLTSMEDLEKAAESQGVSYEDFKQNMKNNLITQAVIGQEVGSHLTITHEEMEKFYEEHKTELEQPEAVRLSEILIAPAVTKEGDKPLPPTQEQLDAARAKADELLKQIKAGAKFDELARKNSNGPTADQGGDLGYFKRGALSKELEDRTFAMKKGEVSDVTATRQGFVILKVTDHPTAGVPPFKEVEGEVQNALYLKKLQPSLRAYLTKLREEAYIDIKPGFVDSGASPNQTKPIITAQNSPEAAGGKSKKRHKKLGVF